MQVRLSAALAHGYASARDRVDARPAPAGGPHQGDGRIELSDAHCDCVTLRLQGGRVRRCDFDVVRNSGIVALVGVIGGRFARMSKRPRRPSRSSARWCRPARLSSTS